jgi:hypothetical protein
MVSGVGGWVRAHGHARVHAHAHALGLDLDLDLALALEGWKSCRSAVEARSVDSVTLLVPPDLAPSHDARMSESGRGYVEEER